MLAEAACKTWLGISCFALSAALWKFYQIGGYRIFRMKNWHNKMPHEMEINHHVVQLLNEPGLNKAKLLRIFMDNSTLLCKRGKLSKLPIHVACAADIVEIELGNKL